MAKLGVSFYSHGLIYRDVATLVKLAKDHGSDSVFVVEAGVTTTSWPCLRRWRWQRAISQ